MTLRVSMNTCRTRLICICSLSVLRHWTLQSACTSTKLARSLTASQRQCPRWSAVTQHRECVHWYRGALSLSGTTSGHHNSSDSCTSPERAALVPSFSVRLHLCKSDSRSASLLKLHTERSQRLLSDVLHMFVIHDCTRRRSDNT